MKQLFKHYNIVVLKDYKITGWYFTDKFKKINKVEYYATLENMSNDLYDYLHNNRLKGNIKPFRRS